MEQESWSNYFHHRNNPTERTQDHADAFQRKRI